MDDIRVAKLNEQLRSGRVNNQKLIFESGNELAAYAAKQINYHVMGYYPITPSTQIAELLDDMKAKGMHDIYMMPETSEANQLRLYKAVDFPYKWELQSVLYDDIAVVDTVFVKTEDNIMYAVGQKLPEKKNVLFKIDTNTWKAELAALKGNYMDKRPAGNFIQYDNGIYHALQECGRVYGEYLHLCKLDSFDGETLQEKEIGTYSVSDMTINSNRNYRRVHTLNKMGDLEVIDLLYYQFNPTILLEKAKRAIKK